MVSGSHVAFHLTSKGMSMMNAFSCSGRMRVRCSGVTIVDVLAEVLGDAMVCFPLNCMVYSLV
jgi:hypothetical protein